MVKFDPQQYRYSSRRNVVYARHAMACTSVPQGAQIGLEVMKAGGNAMDAAVAWRQLCRFWSQRETDWAAIALRWFGRRKTKNYTG